jgi:hypothetical protein
VVVLVVIVCVATAVLLAWLLLEFASRTFVDLGLPYRPSAWLSDILGFASTPAPRGTSRQRGPPGESSIEVAVAHSTPPGAPSTAVRPGFDPVLAQTLVMAPVASPTINRVRAVASAPAPVTSTPATPAATPAAAPAPPPTVAPIRADKPTVEPWAPAADGAAAEGADVRGTPVGSNREVMRDFGAAARRRAMIVGSRAREAILGYGFPNAPDTGAGAPHGGAEPDPGQTVVLVGDDVEAWVRERLYGGRLPDR